MFREQASKISSAGFLPAHFPVTWQLPSLGKDAREASLPGTQIPGREKFWGLPGLKARAESAIPMKLVKGRDAFSADVGDSKCFGFPLELGPSKL